jgi:hypothetical protein
MITEGQVLIYSSFIKVGDTGLEPVAIQPVRHYGINTYKRNIWISTYISTIVLYFYL